MSETETSFEEMTKAELQEIAKRMDIPHTGTKAEIIERIVGTAEGAVDADIADGQEDEGGAVTNQGESALDLLIQCKDLLEAQAANPGKTSVNIKRQLRAVNAAVQTFL